MSLLREWFAKMEVAEGSGTAEGAASRLDREEVIAEAERACGKAFSRLAASVTPAALAWAEAANPEALAACREAERGAMSFPTPQTPEELTGLEAALAEIEAAWERAQGGYPVVKVLADSVVGWLTVYLARPVEPEILDRFAARLRAAVRAGTEVAFRVGASEEGRGIPVRSLREIDVPPERPPVWPGDKVLFCNLEGAVISAGPGDLLGEAVLVRFPDGREIRAAPEILVPAGPGWWRVELSPETSAWLLEGVKPEADVRILPRAGVASAAGEVGGPRRSLLPKRKRMTLGGWKACRK